MTPELGMNVAPTGSLSWRLGEVYKVQQYTAALQTSGADDACTYGKLGSLGSTSSRHILCGMKPEAKNQGNIMGHKLGENSR